MLVILLKYMCTFVNVGYIVPTCVELYGYRDIVWEIFLDILILQESFLHSTGKFLQIQKIIKNATTHFNFVRKFLAHVGKIPTNLETILKCNNIF